MALAAPALALDRAQAEASAISKAEWKSACGLSYWDCPWAQINAANGPYSGTTQWEVIVTVFREHGSTAQYCAWNIPIKENGDWAPGVYGGCRSASGGGG